MSLILIDGSALFYRSHYAFANRPLTAASGEITSVVYGFFNSLLRLIDSQRPEYLAVVFDVKGKNFRHEMYADYKANRKPMPEELAQQLPRLREALEAWGVPILERQGYEADDVMATVARRMAPDCGQAWFYTGDKDFMQLLNERIGMLKPGRRGDEVSKLTAADIERKYGLQPAALIDVFALSGDSSDNIPGAPGVGEKTALKLIKEFGSLEGLYEQLDTSKLTPRLKRVLTENREQVLLSRRLFVIDSEVPLEVDLEQLRVVLPTSAELRSLLGELGLRRIQALIDKTVAALGDSVAGAEDPEPTKPAPAAAEKAPAAPDGSGGAPASDAALEERGYELLTSAEALAGWLAGLSALPPATPLAVDTETDGLRVDTARLVGISLAAPGLAPAYLPVLMREDAEGATEEGSLFATGAEVSQLDWVRDGLAPILADPLRLKVGQNLKYDEWILGRHGLDIAGPRFDTMLASYVLDPGRHGHGLDVLALDLLDHRMISYKELFSAGNRQRDILAVPLARLALYAAEDAEVTLRLYEVLRVQLKTAGLEELFNDLEMPVSQVLLRMERNGIMIDRPFLDELRTQFAAELTRLGAEIRTAAGEDFNIQSPQQLAHILFEKIGLKPVKKTATGWSTDVSVLTRLADEHPLPALILEYRQVAKLQNTYVETLPNLANPETGLIHTSYNQAVAATGRLSSSDPNLQNIPVRTELGRQIRRAFVPRRPENLFISADYSQVELRLLAHLSQDPALRAAFRDGGDVHRRTAALINGVAEDAVSSEMRSRAKAINFGVIYGMGARALARQISVTMAEAKAFIESYFATYPGVRIFIDETKDRGREVGYTETLLGRRRLLPDIMSSNNRVRSFQERIAVNTPIQGTAADLIKLAMIRIDEQLREHPSGALLLLQVHDELVLEVPAAEVETVGELVRRDMESALELSVPLVVDLHTGANWAEAHG